MNKKMKKRIFTILSIMMALRTIAGKNIGKRMVIMAMVAFITGSVGGSVSIGVNSSTQQFGTATAEAADIYTPVYYNMARDATVVTNSLSLNKRSQPR